MQPKRSAAVVPFNTRHLYKELDRLPDPLLLAENTKRLLESGQQEKAYELIKLAGNRMSCTVSWNHLLDYNLEKRDVPRAWKLFNDMKKRGQQPDAYTFTILLRGLAMNAAGNRFALEKAETVFLSMHAPSSPVKPNNIHLNSMLNACAQAGDLDKMFEMAGNIPTGRHKGPDAVTYAIILNGIRASTETNSHETHEGHQNEKREKAVLHAKRIWADVIQQWVSGAVSIDENLVCAMGRVLLFTTRRALKDRPKMSKPPRWFKEAADDVLSLVEQTMQLPRPFPKRAWKGIPPKQELGQATEKPANPGAEQEHWAQDGLLARIDQGNLDANAPAHQDTKPTGSFGSFEDRTFDAVPSGRISVRRFVEPGNNSLSMILAACTNLQAYQAGTEYWRQITQSFQPDGAACHEYLRMLRYQRASRMAADLVSKMKLAKKDGGYGVGVENKTFIIAISACVRDYKNPSALKTAVEIMNIMRVSLPNTPPKVCEDFQLLMKLRGEGEDLSTILSAVQCLKYVFNEEQSRFMFGDFESRPVRRAADDADGGRRNDSKTGRISDSQKQEILRMSTTVEGSMLTVLNQYGEQMKSPDRAALRKSVTWIRAWRLKHYPDDPHARQWRKKKNETDVVAFGRHERPRISKGDQREEQKEEAN